MRDIQFLIGYAEGLPQVDTSRVAVIGASLGGTAGLVAAATDDRIKALLALDGAFHYYPDLTEGVSWMKPERVNIPVLFFTSGAHTQDKSTHDDLKRQGENSWLKKLKYGDFYRLNIEPLDHGAFMSTSIRIGSAARFKAFPKPQVIEAYGWMARYSLQFLNALLKNDTASLAFLKNEPQKNGAPAIWLQMEARPGIGPAPSLERMALELAQRGYEHLPAVLASARARQPDFKPSESTVYYWAQNLLEAGKIEQAIEVFKLNTTLYPDRAWNHIVLAKTLVQVKKPELALQSLQKALQVDPGHGLAAARLKALQAEMEAAK
jgi:tetratricopeptide (TPR) repeat protein